MRIDFESEGGYANIRLKYHADTARLPRDVAEKLSDLVECSGALELQQASEAPKRAFPDAIQYRLSVSDGNIVRSFSFNDVTAPAALRPLLAYLQTLAFEARRVGPSSR